MSEHYFTDHRCCIPHVAPEYFSRPLTQEAVVDVLRNLLRRWQQLTQEVNIEYWLMFGSLLGAYRDTSIIPYDDDIDIGINADQMPRLVELTGSTSITDRNEDWIPVYETPTDVLRISPRWQSLVCEEDPKYWVDGKFVDKEYGLWVDIFAHHEVSDRLISRKYSPSEGRLPQHPRDWFFPLQDIELEGTVTKAPRRIDKVLENEYGPNFATPDHVVRDGQWVRGMRLLR